MEVRKAHSKDISGISGLHKYTFDRDHFTSTFSDDFLNEFYSYLIKNNEFSYVALAENKNLVGFVVAGFKSKDSVDKFVKNNYLKLFFILLNNPKFFLQKIKGVFERISKNQKVSAARELRLLSIVVNKDSQQKGVGSALLKFFEDELKNNGIFK